ncbi:MAG: carbohydrate binding family 9 domain-containing protein, partial [Bacteroidales bacterium]|nr:carbohydrate binding family 9 domain-containing protein [Bacteroidales bacterium]
MMYRRFLFLTISIFIFVSALSQDEGVATVSAGLINEAVHLDGILDDAVWDKAGTISVFKMIDPTENAEPSFPTTVKVMADKKNIYLGIICSDPNPDKMVVFSKARDSELEDEDYIKFVFDTYGDGRSAYIFAINAFGARYDALASNRGESEDKSWDGIWDAKTHLLP